MPVSQATLLNFASKAPMQKSAEVINFAKASRKQTAFLSHSHKNADLAKGVQAFLQAEGWDVYIDWEDSGMPESPNRETAERIQAKIRDLNWFLFLATKNSTESRWCPWEIGYADGVHRARSNKGHALVRGRRAPLIGVVSMDAMTVNVSNIPGVQVGDVVTVIGQDQNDQITAEEVAEWSGTISWEVLVSLGPRVGRRYSE